MAVLPVVVLLVALLAGAVACGGDREPDRLSLHRRLALAERVVLAVPEPLAAEARGAADRALARGVHPPLEVHLLGRSLPPGPRVVVGTLDAPGVAALAAPLGVVRDGRGLAFGAAPELGRFELLAATFEDPERPGLPLTLVLTERAAEARFYLDRLVPAARPSFSAWNLGQRTCSGELTLDGRLVRERVLEVAEERLAEAARERRAAGIVLRVDEGVDAGRALADLEAARERVLAAVGPGLVEPGAEPPVVRVRVFAHPEDLARATGQGDLWITGPAGRSAASYAGGGLDDGGAGYARALALRLLDVPRTAWVADALAVHAADRWWGRPLERWGARLWRGGLVPDEAAAVLDASTPLSPHVVVPLRALLLRGWLESSSPESSPHGDLRALWTGALTLDTERAWTNLRENLATLAEVLGPELEAAREERAAAAAERPFRYGVNLFAPTPDDGPAPAGFGTRASDRSLERLGALGANAVAVLVDGVSYPGPPRTALDPPAPGPRPVAGDLALVATLRRAAGLGLGAMVRPLLRETPSGTWAGDHAEETEERHRLFFERYGTYLVHVALLAELGGAELVCVGTQLGRATRSDPDDNRWIPDFTNRNDALWRGLIAEARGAFDGALTYAADARGESRRVQFFDALDHPAVDLYWALSALPPDEIPGSAAPTAGDIARRLRAELVLAASLGTEVGAPCLVTEIGFPSSSLAWQAPDETRGAPDVEVQTRLLEALVEAYLGLRPPVEGLGGIYLFGWSTDPDAGRALDEGFSFQNRPGEQAAARLFRSAARLEDG